MELLFCVLTFSAAICQAARGSRHSASRVLAFLSVGALVLHLLLDGWRWQLYPAYVVFIILALASVTPFSWKAGWRLVAAVPLSLLMLTSTVLVYVMPVRDLPAPTGPYSVGTFRYMLQDTSRVERFNPEEKRKLYVQVWYPSEIGAADDYPVKPLWNNLSRSDLGGFSFMADYFQNMSSNSYIEAPISSDSQFPVLLFNPGFGMFPEINTILMEHLASNGYVIFGIGHPYEGILPSQEFDFPRFAREVPFDITRGETQSPDFLYFGSGGDIADKSPDKSIRELEYEIVNKLVDEFEQAPNLDSRDNLVESALSQGMLSFLNEPVSHKLLSDFLMTRLHMNFSTQTWVEDTQFVLENIPLLEPPVDNFSASLSIEKLGVFGMSFGGAVAGEFCKQDNRCIAGANLDGQQWGHNWQKAPKSPFLRWRSEGPPGPNDISYSFSTNDFYDYEVSGAFHGDFTDLPFVLPILGKAGINGPIEATRVLEIVNTIQLRFFDKYLKGSPADLNGEVQFPEITRDRYRN